MNLTKEVLLAVAELQRKYPRFYLAGSAALIVSDLEVMNQRALEKALFDKYV